MRGVNVLFSGLAIFHLAYLAVMFDTSEEQDKVVPHSLSFLVANIRSHYLLEFILVLTKL